MLYSDYSRKAGEWIPNQHGGRENLENVEFLRHLNDVVRERCPGALMIAEESKAWPGVTRATADGGLGFHYKWNMGWMHDSVNYGENDPIQRRNHQAKTTFGLVYAYPEHVVLRLAHEEVGKGQGTRIGRKQGEK